MVVHVTCTEFTDGTRALNLRGLTQCLFVGMTVARIEYLGAHNTRGAGP